MNDDITKRDSLFMGIGIVLGFLIDYLLNGWSMYLL